MQNENIQNERKESSQDEMLSGILQKLSPQGTGTASTASSGTANVGGDIFSALLSNPELLSKLPTILSTVKPIIELLGSGGNIQASATQSSAPQAAISAITPQSAPAALQRTNPSSDSRTALLCAMKPYLSRERQNAIDYIVKLGRLGDILKTL